MTAIRKDMYGEDLGAAGRTLGRTFGAVVGLYAMALGVVLLKEYFHGWVVVPVVVETRGEYGLDELFTRLMCVAVVVGGLVSARAAQTRGVRRAAAVMTALGIVLYAGETNLVANKLQPILAAGFAVVVLWLLWHHARRALWPVLLAGSFAGLGLAADYLHDRQLFEAGPALLTHLVHSEEVLDMLSLTAFAHAAWSLQRGAMSRWISRVGPTHTGLLLLACIAVVIGQSYSHWQYPIPVMQQALAIALAWAGTLAALWVNERRLAPGVRLGTQDRALFVAVVFLAGAVIPTFYYGRDGRLDLLYWPLIITAIVVYLCRARWETPPPPDPAR